MRLLKAICRTECELLSNSAWASFECVSAWWRASYQRLSRLGSVARTRPLRAPARPLSGPLPRHTHAGHLHPRVPNRTSRQPIPLPFSKYYSRNYSAKHRWADYLYCWTNNLSRESWKNISRSTHPNVKTRLSCVGARYLSAVPAKPARFVTDARANIACAPPAGSLSNSYFTSSNSRLRRLRYSIMSAAQGHHEDITLF